MSVQSDDIDAALCQEIVKDIIEEQILNLTRMRRLDVPATGPVRGILATYARRAAVACHRGEVPKPDLAAIENRDFANQVERALLDNGIDDLISSTHARVRAANPGKPLDEDAKDYRYCYFKIAIYVSQVSWMIRHGLDPNILSMSRQAMERSFAKLTAIAREAGKPVAINKPRRPPS